MKGFLAWFKGSTKLKRWILVILAGIILSCYGFANVLVTDEMSFENMAKIIAIFAVGFTMVIVGLIFIQKRTLELTIEADAVNKPSENLDIRSLIFNKNVYEKGPKIVVIGGGDGLITILEGLKKYTSNITAIVTASDYGIPLDVQKTEVGLIPMRDIKNGFVGLASDSEVMRKVLEYKFSDDSFGDFTFGEIYIAAMREMYGNYTDSIGESNNFLNISGKVLPVTVDGMQICIELKDGTIIKERHKIKEIIGQKVSPINRVFVNPTNAKPTPGVVEAIKDADAIVIGPGSLYMNILPNLLVKEVAKAVKESKALKVYVSNIMTEPYQTDDYSVDDHINAIVEHLGRGMIDFCICDTGDVAPEYIRRYNLVGADLLEQDFQKVKDRGIRVIKKDMATIVNGHLRHDPEILAATIADLLCTDLRFKSRESDPQYILLNVKLKEGKQHEKVKNRGKRKIHRIEKNAKKQQQAERFKRTSKFSEKYKERIESIQATEEQKIKNRLEYELKNKK